MRRRLLTVLLRVRAAGGVVVTLLGTRLRREFFPEVDAGAFEIYVRGTTGTRIEVTEEKIAKVENFVRETIQDDLQLIISELGVTADWSAAYTPNSGPMDAVVKVQLESERAALRAGIRRSASRGLCQEPGVLVVGICLRRGWDDPRRHERRKVDTH